MPKGRHVDIARSRRERAGEAQARRQGRLTRAIVPIPSGPARRTHFFLPPNHRQGASHATRHTRAARADSSPTASAADSDHVPVVKFFFPIGAATWLVTEMDPDENDHLFGLADLGMGFPELGWHLAVGAGEFPGTVWASASSGTSTSSPGTRFPCTPRPPAPPSRIVETGPLLEDAARGHPTRGDNTADTAADAAVRRRHGRQGHDRQPAGRPRRWPSRRTAVRGAAVHRMKS